MSKLSLWVIIKEPIESIAQCVSVLLTNIAIPPQYAHAWNFSEGLGAVVVDDKVGFINPQGEWVIPCQFTVSRNAIHNVGFAFHDSLCVMTNENDLCGLINQSGEWVLQSQYDRIWNPNKAHQRIY